TEHNFTGECAYADPIPFAGALAARTSRARLGFAVIQMALHHPVRIAIQLAVLDNLSRRRLEVGIGRGSSYNEYEYVGFGLRSDDSRDRMEEAVEVLRRAWTEEPFVHDGKFFSLRLPAIRPRPVQRPHPPIWRSVISLDSLAECGREGIPVMMSRVPTTRIPERLARYREGLEARGPAAATPRALRDACAGRLADRGVARRRPRPRHVPGELGRAPPRQGHGVAAPLRCARRPRISYLRRDGIMTKSNDVDRGRRAFLKGAAAVAAAGPLIITELSIAQTRTIYVNTWGGS